MLTREGVGRDRYEIELPELVAGDEPYDAILRVVADEGLYVVHESEQAGLAKPPGRPLAFTPTGARVTAMLEVAATGDGRASNRIALDPDAVAYVSDRSPRLVLYRQAQAELPMRVVATWVSAAGGEPAALTSDEFRQRAQPQAALGLELPRDGNFELRLQTYQLDPRTDAVASVPDQDELFRFMVDTEPPRLTVRGLDAGQVLTQGSGEIGLTVGSASEQGGTDGITEAGSPVDWTWQLLGPGGLVRASDSASLAVEPQPLNLSLGQPWEGGETSGDGHYVLRVLARDAAGNDGQPVEVPFEVAMTGPRSLVTVPQRDRLWSRAGTTDRWQVEVVVTDPNGVRSASCRAVALDEAGRPASTPPSLEIVLEADEGGGIAGGPGAAVPTSTVFHGSAQFPHS